YAPVEERVRDAVFQRFRRQVAQYGVRVGAVLPGPVVTLGADVYGKSALDATQTGRRIDGGGKLPMHASGAGKAFLAQLS
ncbi:hypothetical protein R1N18_29415, partial [Klebsiella sp. 75989]